MRRDLIILDHKWPEEDSGWSRLQLLRMDPRTARVPIVPCAGAAKEIEGLGSHLAEMGIRIVLKPFNTDYLSKTIAAVLGGGAA
ncbi:MAG: hypothetical protein M3144_01515 [Actinomycetota bacterium]|nr:hypothetical protein [Actinomycetota bacterium]